MITKFEDFMNESKKYLEVRVNLKNFENESPMLWDRFREKAKKAKIDLNATSIKLPAKGYDEVFAYVILQEKPIALDFGVPIQYVSFRNKKDTQTSKSNESKYNSMFKAFDANEVDVPSDVFNAIENELPEPQYLHINSDDLSDTIIEECDKFVASLKLVKFSFDSELLNTEGEPLYTFRCYKRNKAQFGILTNTETDDMYLITMPIYVSVVGSLIEGQ